MVAGDDHTGDIAGVAGWYPDKYDWPGILWLNWFSVHAAHRDTRRLYVDTSTDAAYDNAVRLYERFGFREEGRLVDYYEIGEDFLILGLDLSG